MFLINKVAVVTGAVVTGASKGIGADIARALATEGASVVVNYSSSKEDAGKVVAAIVASRRQSYRDTWDVSEQLDITRLFAESKKAFGKLDILVNNAGAYAFAALDEITEELFHAGYRLQRKFSSRSAWPRKFFSGKIHRAILRSIHATGDLRTATTSIASTETNECRMGCGVPPLNASFSVPRSTSCCRM